MVRHGSSWDEEAFYGRMGSDSDELDKSEKKV